MGQTQPYRVKGPPRTARRANIPLRTGCDCCSCQPGQPDEFCRAHGDGITYRSCEAHREVGRIHQDRTDVVMMLSVQQHRQGVAVNP
jgi:hypothetical protein